MTDPEATAEDMQIAMGLAAHGVAFEMLSMLRSKGILDDVDCATVVDRALTSIENLDLLEPHRLFRLARELLEMQAHRWTGGGTGEG